jgi:hypothetical protein
MLVRETEKNARRKRGQITLVFDPTQMVPDHALNAIIDNWLVPSLVEEFSAELRARRKAHDLGLARSIKNTQSGHWRAVGRCSDELILQSP